MMSRFAMFCAIFLRSYLDFFGSAALGMAIQLAGRLDLALCRPGGFFRKLHNATKRPTRRMELTTWTLS